MIFDVTRAMADRDSSLAGNDTLKMTRSFARCFKNRLGVIVPFQRCIEAFRSLAEEGLRRKLGVECPEDEVFVGTPEMFRGVEKDIIIVTHLRNSVVDGLGYFDKEEYVKLALSRARHFLWVVCASPTFAGSTTPGAQLLNALVKSV